MKLREFIYNALDFLGTAFVMLSCLLVMVVLCIGISLWFGLPEWLLVAIMFGLLLAFGLMAWQKTK